MKHTPGPWGAGPFGESWTIWMECPPDYHQVCIPQTRENANLISAAPEMFHALKLTTALLDEYPTVKSIVMQALAKADGVEP